MLSKFFCTHWKYSSKNDWTDQARLDLADFGITENLEQIRNQSKNKFKRIVKLKAKEFAFYNFLERKESHTKMANLFYTELKLQEYLKLDDISFTQAQALFSYITRMANFSENFRGLSGPQLCPLCKQHFDSQNLCWQCPLVKENVNLEGEYKNIFQNKPNSKLVKTLVNINKFREEYIKTRQLK